MKNHNPIPPISGFPAISHVALIVPTICIACLSLALPLLIWMVYDRVLPHPESGTPGILIAGICIAIALETVLRLCRAYRLGRGAAHYEHKMECMAVNHILNADLSILRRFSSSDSLNRISAIRKLRNFNSGYDLVIYTELLFVILSLGIIAYIAGMLVAIPVIILTFFIITSILIGRRLNPVFMERDIADEKRYDFLTETLKGIHTIKSFVLEKQFQRRYEYLQNYAAIANQDIAALTAHRLNIAKIHTHIMLGGVIIAGAFLVLEGHMTSGALMASILLSGAIIYPVQRALDLWVQYQGCSVAQQKISSIFEIPSLNHAPGSGADFEKEIKGKIRITNLSMGGLFHHIDMEARLGEIIQISGMHGAGKTTLLKIMAGLYEGDTGRILIDDDDVQNYAPQELSKHIGYLSSDGVLFRGTIRDNLTRFGTIPQDQIKNIAMILGIESDVPRLIHGFDTWVEGTSQDSIPAGLRQRISIARTLATKPRIILFDNADRNLDRESYRHVHALLGRLKQKVTMIMVTNDQNLSRLATRRMVLTQGGLHEVHANNEVESIFKELRA